MLPPRESSASEMASFADRAARVRDRVDLAALIGGSIKLRGSRNPRGQCPFHGSKSDSLAVYGAAGRWKCWGCGAGGDAVSFVEQMFGLSAADALARLEADHGLADLEATPVRRERAPVRARPRGPSEPVSNEVWAREIRRRCVADREAVRRWFVARGVPAAVLTDERLSDVLFAPLVPIRPWLESERADDVPQAPAVVARCRNPVTWRPQALHLTFLAPCGTQKMRRERRDGSLYPDRKMVGSAGGAAVIFGPHPVPVAAPIVAGEGLETVLSGLAMLSCGAQAVGAAVLSLDNLQGRALTWKGGVLPLFDVRSDPTRRGLAWAGEGPVTLLIDADMKPLKGPVDQRSRQHRGFPLVERRGGPIVRRAITSAERSEICAALAIDSWRAAGRTRVTAVRPPMGMDFNDAVRSVA